MIADRFLTEPQMEDLLFAYGINWPSYALPMERLAECFGVQLTRSYSRPTVRGGASLGFRSVARPDAVHMLIELKRLGLPIEPRSLVTALVDHVADARTLSASELSAYWYRSQRDKWPPRTIGSEGRTNRSNAIRETHRTATGYTVEFWRDADRIPREMTVRAPRYRRPRRQIDATCPECAFEYTQGDPDSSAAHRREHRVRMSVLAPRANRRIQAVCEPDTGRVRVTARSPVWLHREMYERARAFKREFRYDFVKWGSGRRDDDPMVQGFLFVTPDDRFTGACAFRWRDFSTDAPARWGLQWIWISPAFRRQELSIITGLGFGPSLAISWSRHRLRPPWTLFSVLMGMRDY
ncbi:MAG: hypothetical protein IPF83_08650 [Rhodanobacteraceae bacterium]|nr:hypothetical protein [Rhodanobacteraceae bacterium]